MAPRLSTVDQQRVRRARTSAIAHDPTRPQPRCTLLLPPRGDDPLRGRLGVAQPGASRLRDGHHHASGLPGPSGHTAIPWPNCPIAISSSMPIEGTANFVAADATAHRELQCATGGPGAAARVFRRRPRAGARGPGRARITPVGAPFGGPPPPPFLG